MATDEGIACTAALAALIDGEEVLDDELTIKQWEAAERLYHAIPDSPVSDEDRVLKLALGYAIGDPSPTLRQAELMLAGRMLNEYKRKMGV